MFVFVCIELIYFELAKRFNIVDTPNERSSHNSITIRGGGILFPISWILYSLVNGFIYPWITIGLFAIAVVSFLDDRIAISRRLRILIHLTAFTLCFIELNLFNSLSWWLIPVVYIIGIGCLNAVNFMDGINGMTGLYSLSVLLPIQWMLYHQWWNGSIFNYLILAVLVFGIFNFRTKARCFAGDVGSVSMGYILVFVLLGLIFNRFEFTSSNPLIGILKNPIYTLKIQFILLLTLYGVDTISTLFQRLFLKENIFEPHRRHLYQVLCNEYKTSHLLVSIIYSVIQLAINLYVLNFSIPFKTVLFFLVFTTIIYGCLKFYLIYKYKIDKLSTG